MEQRFNPDHALSLAQDRLAQMRCEAAMERMAVATRRRHEATVSHHNGSFRDVLGHLLIDMGQVVAGHAVR